MGSYRQIHSKIWKDDWFLDLGPDYKLFFIYLFSNEMASLSGIYELPIRVMSFESGLTNTSINNAFRLFTEAKKAYYVDGVVWIPTLRKYHENPSSKVQIRILKDVNSVRDGELKRIYCERYGIDTVSEDEDGISIPSITYTSTSTITSKGGVGGNGADAEYDKLLVSWKELFPRKPQPRSNNKTLRGRFKTRMKIPHFQENHAAALVRASKSDFVHKGSWFDLGWFLKNDDNYEKCLDGKYDMATGTNQPVSTREKVWPDEIRI